MKVKLLSHVRLFGTSWTVAYRAPLSMGFSRQEYWSGVPLPSPWSSLPFIIKRVVGFVLLSSCHLCPQTLPSHIIGGMVPLEDSRLYYAAIRDCTIPVNTGTAERLHFHFSLFTFMHWRRKWQPTPVFFPGESQGQGSLVGCRLWGRTELDTTEAT